MMDLINRYNEVSKELEKQRGRKSELLGSIKEQKKQLIEELDLETEDVDTDELIKQAEKTLENLQEDISKTEKDLEEDLSTISKELGMYE